MRILIALLFFHSVTGSETYPETAALIAGMISGVSEPLIAQPLTTLKNRAQFGKQGQPLSVRELWRGAPVASICLGINTGIQAGLNACLLAMMHNQLCSSLAAGAFSAYIIAGPSELIIAQQQFQKKGAFQTVATIYNSVGIRGFWRGSNWVAGREALFTAGYLCFAPYCASYLKKQGIPEFIANIAGGITGGVIAMIASHPFDTIKTMLAADIPLNRTAVVQYPTGLHVMRDKSLRTLFSGCAPRVANGTFAITWFALVTPYIQNTWRKNKNELL